MPSEQPDQQLLADQLREMVGIIGFEMVNTVVDDMSGILSKRNEKNYILTEAALDGYVLALSRIIETKIGWECVTEVFRKNNASIPSKYHTLFNITDTDKEKVENDTVSRSPRPSTE